MKTKILRFTAVLSAMLCMICCVFSSVPAFAEDIGTTDNNMTNIRQAISYMKQQIVEKGGTLDGKNYMAVWSYPNDSAINVKLISFPNNSINLTNGKYLFERYVPDIYCDMSKYDYTKWDDYNRYTISISQSTSTTFNGNQEFFIDDSSSKYSWHIIDTNMKITNNGIDVTPVDPNAPPVPFTVDYSPSLKTGLVRKGTLVAPGASNDGQEVETNTIAVTVKLTDAFLNASKPISGAYTYSYQFTCFVVPSEYKDSDIKTMSEHAIYTAAQDNLHYLYNENETLDVDDSLSSEPATGPDIVPVSEQWANATGVSNCFLLERDNNNTPLRNVTIDLHNIDFEKHKSDSYNIVVLGHIVRKSEYGWTAYPSYFKSDCSSLALESTKEYPMNFGSSEQPVVNKNFYYYYSVISDDWSFKDYPKFEPHKVGGVTVGDSPLDFKRTAKGVQDYNMWEQGGTDNTLKPDDFDKYKEQKKLDENFGSVDFGLDSIKSVFDGSSDFFKFLTASIGILPTTFLTILISFFVVMLAICVVKWVLK